MAKGHTMQMRVEPDDLKRLDDLRRQEEDLPSRSEMVRRLILRASGLKRLKTVKR